MCKIIDMLWSHVRHDVGILSDPNHAISALAKEPPTRYRTRNISRTLVTLAVIKAGSNSIFQVV